MRLTGRRRVHWVIRLRVFVFVFKYVDPFLSHRPPLPSSTPRLFQAPHGTQAYRALLSLLCIFKSTAGLLPYILYLHKQKRLVIRTTKNRFTNRTSRHIEEGKCPIDSNTQKQLAVLKARSITPLEEKKEHSQRGFLVVTKANQLQLRFHSTNMANNNLTVPASFIGAVYLREGEVRSRALPACE